MSSAINARIVDRIQDSGKALCSVGQCASTLLPRRLMQYSSILGKRQDVSMWKADIRWLPAERLSRACGPAWGLHRVPCGSRTADRIPTRSGCARPANGPGRRVPCLAGGRHRRQSEFGPGADRKRSAVVAAPREGSGPAGKDCSCAAAAHGVGKASDM